MSNRIIASFFSFFIKKKKFNLKDTDRIETIDRRSIHLFYKNYLIIINHLHKIKQRYFNIKIDSFINFLTLIMIK